MVGEAVPSVSSLFRRVFFSGVYGFFVEEREEEDFF